MALINNNIHTKPMLTERTDRAWFSHLLRHPARKWSGSILTTLEPARGQFTISFWSMPVFYSHHTHTHRHTHTQSQKVSQGLVNKQATEHVSVESVQTIFIQLYTEYILTFYFHYISLYCIILLYLNVLIQSLSINHSTGYFILQPDSYSDHGSGRSSRKPTTLSRWWDAKRQTTCTDALNAIWTRVNLDVFVNRLVNTSSTCSRHSSILLTSALQ